MRQLLTRRRLHRNMSIARRRAGVLALLRRLQVAADAAPW